MDHLPLDVAKHMLTFMDAPTVLSLRATCKRFRDVSLDGVLFVWFGDKYSAPPHSLYTCRRMAHALSHATNVSNSLLEPHLSSTSLCVQVFELKVMEVCFYNAWGTQ
jgi:hypothetical protein